MEDLVPTRFDLGKMSNCRVPVGRWDTCRQLITSSPVASAVVSKPGTLRGGMSVLYIHSIALIFATSNFKIKTLAGGQLMV